MMTTFELLYQDQFEKYFSNKSEKHYKKFKTLIDNVNNKNLSEKKRFQYDKDETIVTLYTFLTLDRLTSDAGFYDVWDPILNKAFNDEVVTAKIRNQFSNGFNLFLEFPLPPNDFIKKSIDPWGKNHPIQYVRESYPKSKKERSTTIDAALFSKSDPKGLIACECKFMSDISCETTYHYARNQIARNIDVGFEKYGGDYYFILVTPRVFYKNRYRFYGYKMLEYMNGKVDTFRQDLILRKDVDDNSIADLSKRIGWITWEDLVEKIFEFQQTILDVPFGELEKFYSDRKLLPSKVS